MMYATPLFGTFHPSREVHGRKSETPVLVLIEGSTDYPWREATQEELTWAPTEVSRSELVVASTESSDD
jgi:hypothetical protein